VDFFGAGSSGLQNSAKHTHASRGRDSVTEITTERETERETCVGRSRAFLLRDCNMISAMAANGALRCPDIICCSSSLQSSADPSLLFSLDRNKEKKTHELYIYVGKNQPLQKATRSHQKSPHSCNPIYSVIQEASRIVFAARQSAAEAV